MYNNENQISSKLWIQQQMDKNNNLRSEGNAASKLHKMQQLHRNTSSVEEEDKVFI